MLVLRFKLDEQVHIGDDVVIKVRAQGMRD